MDKESRLFLLKTMNEAMEFISGRFDKENLERFAHFKIIARETRDGDQSVGEELSIDEIKEYEDYAKE